MVLSGNAVSRMGVARVVHIEERNVKLRGVHIKYPKCQCKTRLVTPGGRALEPLETQTVLDSVYGVAGILERLLERLREHFGGVEVSSLKFGPCQVSGDLGRALQASYDTTNELQVMLKVPRKCINFRVAVVVLAASDDIVIGLARIRFVTTWTYIMRAFHQRVSDA